MYTVDEFRRLLVGSDRQRRGLVQFWGQRALRRSEFRKEFDRWVRHRSKWEVEDESRLHTVEIAYITSIGDRK